MGGFSRLVLGSVSLAMAGHAIGTVVGGASNSRSGRLLSWTRRRATPRAVAPILTRLSGTAGSCVTGLSSASS
ncbi:hypothetical protein [Nonomuraea sp. NPDC049758]|uniref:hypothetical protein n=1 Tax=Nonomuraea sp. NPDC049758 TaxID=3154360 RepID=UPI0034274005